MSSTGCSVSSILSRMGAQRLRALLAQDADKAAHFIHAAALEGWSEAQVCYGRMLLEGSGVPRDPAAALQWFSRAATRGDLEGFNMAGRCHDNGWGVEENAALAAPYFKYAADAGHAWAQYNMGHLFLNGRGVHRSAETAYAYYRLAGDQGHSRAMNLVARCHEQGWGTAQSDALAAEWYERSAQAGYFRGQYNWATMLLDAGRIARAMHWFEQAATGGTTAVRTAVLDRLRHRASCPDARALTARLLSSASEPAAV